MAKSVLLPLLSHLVAAIIGHWMWRNRTWLAGLSTATVNTFLDTLVSHMQWFMTAKPAGMCPLPSITLYSINYRSNYVHLAGIKLHIQMVEALGNVSITYFRLLQEAVSLALPIELVQIIIAACAVSLPLLGLERAGHQAARGTAITLAPVTTLYYIVFATLYRAHLRATIKTWRAMRGETELFSFLFHHHHQGARSDGDDDGGDGSDSRQRGTVVTTRTAIRDGAVPLQQHPPTTAAPPPGPHLPPTQLALASLLFLPFLLTLPTTAWFYYYACCLHFPVRFIISMMSGKYWLPARTRMQNDGDTDRDPFPLAKILQGELVL